MIAPVMEVEGEGKQKGRGEDGAVMPFQWNGGAREVNSGATAWGWRWARAMGQRWAKRLHGIEWNWAWAGEKKKENRAYFGLGQIDSRAEMDRIIGMVAEIDFELIQGFLEFKSKALNIFKPNLNWVQNRINSNNLFGNFSNTKFWNLV
jgi:hypothetical protein